MVSQKLRSRLARKKRIRAKVRGHASRPRLSVYRSGTQIIAQLVDDDAGRTIAMASTRELKARPNKVGAHKLGELIAKKASDAKVVQAVFDRNAHKYHGRVKELADAARAAGMQF